MDCAANRFRWLARILQIADIYDALTSPRSYKPALTTAEARGIIQEETDRGWRDAEVVKTFLRIQKDLLSRMPNFVHPTGRRADAMHTSLANLQNVLACDSSRVTGGKVPAGKCPRPAACAQPAAQWT